MFARIILKSGVSFVVEVEYITHTNGHGVVPDRLRWKCNAGASSILEHVDMDDISAIVKAEHWGRLAVDPAPVPS